MLPFDRDQFISVFVAYNNAIWPAQVAAYVLGMAIVILALRDGHRYRQAIAFGIAAMWLWTGIAYHALYFAPINRAAFFFAALFVAQAIMVGLHGSSRGAVGLAPPKGAAGWIGIGFLAYSAVLYPLIGMWSGHRYPELPMFGVTPCPVTLFTFGMFLLARTPLPKWLLVIPALWSLIGGSAAILLAIPQDWLLLASGIVAVPLIVLRDRSGRPGKDIERADGV